MGHIETIEAIIDLARTGQQIEPGEALNALARLINDMSPAEPNYEARVAGLMQVGATLWNCAVATGVASMEAAGCRA